MVKRMFALLIINNDDKNLAFLTTTSTSSTNSINTGNTGVSTGNSKVNTASAETSTASFSDATAYAFLSSQPQGSQLVHEDLEQIHDDDLEEMDLKWNMALLSMRARKFYQRTGRKIVIDGSSTAGYDKSKVECFNCHKMGHFARECRVPRSKENRNWNQASSSKAVRIEDASEKAMCAIDGGGFDWSDMAEDEVQANMALMAFSDSEVSCSKSCLLNYETLKKQYDDLLVKLDDTAFKASTYKRGLSILEAQVVKYKESEVLFSEEIALLKRSVGHKDYLMGLVKTELEKVKEEKEGIEIKLAKFEKSSKDLDDLLASQVTDKSKKGFGYHAVPSPHPLILNRPTPLDLSYSGLEEFQQPEINCLRASGIVNAVKPQHVGDWRPSQTAMRYIIMSAQGHMSGKQCSLFEIIKNFDEVFSVTFGGGANGEILSLPTTILGKAVSTAAMTKRVVAGTSSNVSAGIQEVSESSTPFQQDQDCIIMPIWKEQQIQLKILHSKSLLDSTRIQDQDVTHDDCSFQDDGFDEHQVNTARVKPVNTGSGDISTATPEVNTATSEGLMGPIPTTEDTQEEDQGIDLGNLSPSYAVSSTPHTRIHKDHPIDHVIGCAVFCSNKKDDNFLF
ncbi:ribonuclease H-like domain-containing protein [Tanacetum coccineum]